MADGDSTTRQVGVARRALYVRWHAGRVIPWLGFLAGLGPVASVDLPQPFEQQVRIVDEGPCTGGDNQS